MCDMVYLSVFVILSLLSPIDGGAPRRPDALNQTTQVKTKVSGRDATLPPPYLHLPVFVDSSLPLVEKEHFFPARGTGQERLPETVREILIPVRRTSTSPPSVSGVSVTTSCKQKKMHVQVQRSVFVTGEPRTQLKLGTCKASKSTKDQLHFEYDFDKCGTKRTTTDNQVIFSNVLRYDPPMFNGPIRRAAPLTLPVKCFYNRYQYTYKIGYTPKMTVRRIFKPMKNRVKFILTPRNAQWERLSPSDQYMLGKPMYFEAEASSMSQDKRLYVHSCYATPGRSHTAKLQFPVVENFGCMVESKTNHSRFILYKNNAVRFSVDAFLFKGMTDQQLSLHCTMSVGSSVPSPTEKSCNYDPKAGRWVELYGSDSVCACCDSSCSSAPSAVTKIISSRPWTVEPKVKPTITPKRKKVSTTTTTTPTTAAPQPETTRELTAQSTTSQPDAIAPTPTGKVENAVEEQEWPFGGGGVRWVEVEGEQRQVKGSAVVEEEEEEEEEEEVFTAPHRIFEEIFDFDE